VTVDFQLTEDTRSLMSDVRDWALTEGRAMARRSDRELGVSPEMRDKILQSCPMDVSPLMAGHGAPDRSGNKEFVIGERDGSHILGVGVTELTAYGDVGLTMLMRGSGIGSSVVELLGTPEQSERWVGGIDRGEFSKTGFALTEPDHGSDAAGLTSNARRQGEGWILNGRKNMCSHGAEADYLIVFATLDPALGHRGIRGFIVPGGTAGLSFPKPYEPKMGIRSTPTAEILLEDVVVPFDHCLGDPERTDGFGQAMAALGSARPYATAFAVGVGQAALDVARDFVGAERSVFAPRRWERIEESVHRMNAALERCRLLVRSAAWRMDAGLPYGREGSQAKAYSCPVAERIVARSLLLMGAEGYSERNLVEKWYRDVKTMDIWEGAGNIQKLVVGRHLATSGPTTI
jgi:acyl-CoA dehydrogenase